MQDIKITLSTESTVRAPSIEAEADWIRRSCEMGYPPNSEPRHTGDGSWVRSIRGGELGARARVLSLTKQSETAGAAQVWQLVLQLKASGSSV